ncbi:MAG TPA: 3-hydroxyacyl-CoA dehydrogenase/enoyl-CoA hydratase family protein [Bryobacteraceae bacterium]|nr:3-hydroxyacyl-CoA dehydrogenase/enoyl-CoA hydratase family protein [Bryobacteraceae bacterium]
MKNLRQIGVLGAGTMGSRIAAHFANAGVPALLLDLPAATGPDRSAAARKGIEAAGKQKPGGMYTAATAALITPGNFDDHMAQLASCDWIIEAVTENLEIKQSIWSRIVAHASSTAILSTNTSGIPLGHIAAEFPAEAKSRFLGTHFFNPPRYLHLVEVIPTPETDESILAYVSRFCDMRLGKGVVICKDTPNFIANRIGSFFGGTTAKYALEDGFTVEEVDALTGSLIGLPNSASFRLLDIVGLDVWAFVGSNLHGLVPHDPWRERFLPPPFLEEMMRRGWLGEKSGQGFYRRVGKGDDKTIEAIDLNTFEYHPAAKVSMPSVEAARNISGLPERLRSLVAANDRAGTFLWKLLSDHMLYAAERVPEISDRIVEIDHAMRWGYAHTYGPFELWDALGFETTARRIEAEGRGLPEAVTRMLSAGARSFYRAADRDRTPHTEYFELTGGQFRELEVRPGITVLADTKRARGVVQSNPGASLVDLGDGVLCVEFHSKMNSIGEDTVRMLHAGLEETERNHRAMIIANQGGDFCVGANLMLVLMAAQNEEWDELDAAVRRFQNVCMALKYAPFPVVAAPFARTLGGGTEISLHTARVQAAAELYMGLVEVGVGVIPAGGGCKEMLLRLGDARKAFELIGMAKVSTSAENARELRLLAKLDAVSMNQERLIDDAKQLALSLAPGYLPPSAGLTVNVGGDPAFAMMKMGAWLMHQGGFATDYDMVVAEKLAHVLSGGRLTAPQPVSEQYLLDLEREAFLSLCGDARTQARMQHMLKTGKPLRN